MDKAVQELLELRAEKQKYVELQALLRQGLANLKEQQERLEMAEAEHKQALKDIANISVDVDTFFERLQNAYNKYIRHLRTPTVLNMKKRDRLDYVDEKYIEWLGENISFHEEAIGVLKKALNTLQGDREVAQERRRQTILTRYPEGTTFGGYRIPEDELAKTLGNQAK